MNKETNNKLANINKALKYIDERIDILNRIEAKYQEENLSNDIFINFEKETLSDLKKILGSDKECLLEEKS